MISSPLERRSQERKRALIESDLARQGEGEDGSRSAATYNMKRNSCEHIGTRKHIRNTLEAFKWLKQLACLLYFRISARRSQLQFYNSNLVRSLVPLLSELYHVQKAK